jgi:hypothetical protein
LIAGSPLTALRNASNRATGDGTADYICVIRARIGERATDHRSAEHYRKQISFGTHRLLEETRSFALSVSWGIPNKPAISLAATQLVTETSTANRVRINEMLAHTHLQRRLRSFIKLIQQCSYFLLK